MLVFGKITSIDGYKANLFIDEYDSFNVECHILQKYTVKNKSKILPEINQLVAAILTDDMTEGVILGGIYNDEDTPAEDIEGDEFTNYEDGSSISHTENAFNLTVENLIVTGNIKASGEIEDKNGTLDSVRTHSNNHLHKNGNNGANTGTPTTQV